MSHLAGALSGSFGALAFKGRGLLQLAVARVGQCVDRTLEAELAGFLGAEANVAGGFAHGLCLGTQLIQHSSASLIKAAAGLNQLAAEISHAVLFGDSSDARDSGALSLGSLGSRFSPHRHEIGGVVFHISRRWDR